MTTLRLIVAAMVLSTSTPVWAQEEGEEITDPVILEYDGRRVPIYPAFEDYSYMLWDVCDAMKVPQSICNQILPMNGDLGGNAVATIVEGNAVIVYDRTLSSDVGYAGAQAIIAHELGHFICGHLGKRPSQQQELEADRFAGAAMRASGQDLAGTLDMAIVLDERESHSHPGRAERIEALKAGWSDPEAARTCRP